MASRVQLNVDFVFFFFFPQSYYNVSSESRITTHSPTNEASEKIAATKFSLEDLTKGGDH